MASVDFEALKTALSGDDPCGPDLDRDLDENYMNFVTSLEGLLPTTFFNEGIPFSFDSAIINVEQQRTRCLEFLQGTRDLRLLVLLARLFILDRDLANFAKTIDVISSLLEQFWEPVHPQAEGGRYAMRAAILGVLDEPTIVFSLQYCRLCETRRQGPVSFRSYLYAIREAEPRAGEEIPTENTLVQAVRESEDQITATRASLDLLRSTLQRVSVIWSTNADILSSPKLSNSASTVARIIAFLEMADPPSSSPPAIEAAETSSSEAHISTKNNSVATAFDAGRALEAATAYFIHREPSSPVLPLIVQAQQLLGKSFPEILQTLLPDQVSYASYQIGRRPFFQLPLERLPTFETSGSMYALSAIADDGQTGSADQSPSASPTDQFKADTRGQALGLLDEVSRYLRTNEPGSPIPWLIERAKALAERDFLSILRSVLPESALKDLDQ